MGKKKSTKKGNSATSKEASTPSGTPPIGEPVADTVVNISFLKRKLGDPLRESSSSSSKKKKGKSLTNKLCEKNKVPYEDLDRLQVKTKQTRNRIPATVLNITKFDMRKNHDYCNCCKGTGTLICCDKCPRSFHFECVDPPMDPKSPPEGDWFCRVCSPKPLPKGHSNKGLFGNLLEIINRKNPTNFCVPTNIKNSFEGIASNEFGEFIDTSRLKNPRIRYPLPSANIDTYSAVIDNNGSMKQCFHCGLTALHGPIIRCDYCPHYWHLSCTHPIMAVPPPGHLKWMCPAHSDHFIPRQPKLKTTGTADSSGDSNNRGPVHNLDAYEIQIILDCLRKAELDRNSRRFREVKSCMDRQLVLNCLSNPHDLIQNELNVSECFGSLGKKSKSETETPKNSTEPSVTIEELRDLIHDVCEIKRPKELSDEKIYQSVQGCRVLKDTITISRHVARKFYSIQKLLTQVDKNALLKFMLEQTNIKKSS